MTQSPATENLSINVTLQDSRMAIVLRGRLDAYSLPLAWKQAVEPAKENPPKLITVDGKDLAYCDGAGLGFFAELRRIAASVDGKVEFTNLNEELKRLVDMSLLADAKAPYLAPAKCMNAVTFAGMKAYHVLCDQYQLIAFIGRLTAALVWAVAHPHKLRKRELISIMQKTGSDALPVVSLLGLLIGVILAYQMTGPLRTYNAESLIPTIVSFALIRELGPLVTAIIVAGRSGSAFAAEIGTMKVTEELAALETMGLAPAQFLVVPRVLATVLVAPLLTLYGLALGIFGAGLVMLTLGYSFTFYSHAVQESIKLHDYLGGIFKSIVFAIIVSGVGCLRGMQTKSGPGAVGDSTTRAVVAGIVLVIVADAILGVVYYHLGI